MADTGIHQGSDRMSTDDDKTSDEAPAESQATTTKPTGPKCPIDPNTGKEVCPDVITGG